jgi:MoaA/NifB/PqqE/SkfB family radical SAM enzyme
VIQDKRIKEYRYLEQLKQYINTAEKRYLVIEEEDKPFIYPKQLEIHLPSDRQTACNLACTHCFSTLYTKELGRWEPEGLKLLHNLHGDIPYHIYGGAYCEPTANPFLFPFFATTKMYGNHFGLHTNGTYLLELEKNHRFLTNCNEISTDKEDYISISIDAGSGLSWQALKKKDKSNFWNILQAIEMMANIRDKKNKSSHAIRLVFLVSEPTCSQEEFEFIVALAKMYKLDSVRFSVPYDYYARDFKDVKEYKSSKEDVIAEKVEQYTKHLISENENENPYVFWNPPFFTDIERFDFEKCFYGFFQITLSSDGYVYPCSAIAAPTASHLRKGKISSDLYKFQYQCWELQNNPVQCRTDCFSHGLRCNRMGLEINEYYNLEENKNV